ncbi:hypothetical protein CERSUDRAFT_90010 [Gelatoporia subvermispora B]|uniref:Methyltransferase domain-containing protein n=1 Tax=Ceriporiopsis subvermispora (strain B) TaxID=914234 RepID=M2RRF0_CERS8|nr:hypothetical protein CERSUDRAFT_90010 [Gelatoporia subvermispora B]
MADNAHGDPVPRDAEGNVIIDPEDFNPDAEELAFLKSQIGIADDQALREHCFKVQADALKARPPSSIRCPIGVYPYNCIRRFSFVKVKIAKLPAYPHLLKLGTERPGAIYLDIGCCLGYDARKAISDGFPVSQVVTSDIRSEFWEVGHALFRSTPETFPVPFLPGNAFDQDFLKRVAPSYEPPSTPAPDLHSLTSLTPLLGHVSAIHASAFIHLFNETQQYQIAESLAGLLSPEPGSFIFGWHVASQERGVLPDSALRRGGTMFCHSPESWAELWDGQIFKKGTVRVDAVLVQNPKPATSHTTSHMQWSVTRL